MPNYRRIFIPGGTYFFTINLLNRRQSLLTENIDALRTAYGYVQTRHPFETLAICVLLDHLDCIWRLPPNYDDYPMRWRLLKSRFSKSLPRSADGLNAALNYDPADRLGWVGSTTNGTRRFVFDGDDIIAELDNSANTVRRYVHGPGTDNPIVCIGVASSCAPGAETTEKIWLLSDLRGSVITYVGEEAIASGQRAVVGASRRNRYDAFGLMANNNNESLFAYTGQIFLPEIGLYHYKARQYNPDLGRFMQTDPIGYEDGTNIYAYVHNDPVNATDPTGEFALGLASKAFKVLRKGGDIGATFAGAASDAKAVFAAPGSSSLGSRGLAAASLASEIFSPVSGRDAKAGFNAAKGAVNKGGDFFRGAKGADAPSLTPRPNEFKVDAVTGTVKPTHGVSVFDNAESVASKGFTPHRVDQSTVPDSLQIIQRGQDKSHFEITPRPGANLTPDQFKEALECIQCLPD